MLFIFSVNTHGLFIQKIKKSLQLLLSEIIKNQLLENICGADLADLTDAVNK